MGLAKWMQRQDPRSSQSLSGSKILPKVFQSTLAYQQQGLKDPARNEVLGWLVAVDGRWCTPLGALEAKMAQLMCSSERTLGRTFWDGGRGCWKEHPKGLADFG